MTTEEALTRAGQLLDDLPSWAADHREDLVLKPNDDYGGRGVVLGSAVAWWWLIANSFGEQLG